MHIAHAQRRLREHILTKALQHISSINTAIVCIMRSIYLLPLKLLTLAPVLKSLQVCLSEEPSLATNICFSLGSLLASLATPTFVFPFNFFWPHWPPFSLLDVLVIASPLCGVLSITVQRLGKLTHITNQ